MSATTFSAEFLGCKVSHTDLQGLRERLADEGYREVGATGEVHVVNGCCVTGEAVAKTRQAVRRALRADASAVLVTGCAARLAGAGFEQLDERVQVLAEPSERVPAAAIDALAALGCRGGDRRAASPLRRRMFLKVQDGCSFPCAYCVIPEVRGGTRSRPVGDVLAEAARRVRQGHREIVVTGVNVGLYRDGPARLADLLLRLADVEGLDRVRLSSIEPNHLEDRLLDVLAEAPYVPHLHVPLQTGSDRLLAGMRRRYRAADYADRIAAARERIAGVAVTADVIAGLPGEEDDDHDATLALVRSAGLVRLHVFPYSPRPGTRTAEEDTPASIKRERAAELRELSDELARVHRAGLIGAADEVLVEEADGADGLGLGRDGTPWRVDGGATRVGEVVRVRGRGILGDGRVDGEEAA